MLAQQRRATLTTLMEVDMQNPDHATYLGDRIAFEDRVAALARSAAARRIHAELAMHYRSELALLRALPAPRGKTHG